MVGVQLLGGKRVRVSADFFVQSLMVLKDAVDHPELHFLSRSYRRKAVQRGKFLKGVAKYFDREIAGIINF